MRVLVRNGRVVDPASGTDAALDVLIEGGRIAEVAPGLRAPDADIVEAAGFVVAPGFIDMHVHFREPGQTHKETIRTGSLAAARGGFTTVCCMPNTTPPNDDPALTAAILAEARRKAAVNVFPIAAVSKGLRGEELCDLAGLAEAGAVGFSDDGMPVFDDGLMRRALEASRSLRALVIDHCEDRSRTEGGQMNEGAVARRLGLRGIPAAAEEVMVARDIRLAEETGARVHIAHLSVRGAVRAVREAKARGVRVTAEATPHHLALTEDALEGRDTNFKMNPPLRSAADVKALRDAVRDGTVDVVATDHAPHAPDEKARPFAEAPFGVIGLETAVSVLLDRLVHTDLISLNRLIELCAAAPARLLGLEGKGRIAPGADADLVLLDLRREIVFEADGFLSKSRNSPFLGEALRGAPVATIVAGRVVYPAVSA
ncbi:MAG: dihydroorotase [Candidatus Aminicenantes bacterium]|nr:dihydroorotase [Candidatus Aminicenantes bacterium]